MTHPGTGLGGLEILWSWDVEPLEEDGKQGEGRGRGAAMKAVV